MGLPRIPPYATWSLPDDLPPTRLAAHGLFLEPPGAPHLEVDLAPHPAFRGYVVLATSEGRVLIEPAAANIAYLFVDRWPPGDQRSELTGRAEPPSLPNLHAVDGAGEKHPIAHGTFLVKIADERELRIDFAPPAPWAHHIRLSCDRGQLEIRPNAANVVLVTALAAPRKARDAQEAPTSCPSPPLPSEGDVVSSLGLTR